MTCNLHISKLLKRQSKKCDSAQFVVILKIDLYMLYCPSKAKTIKISNGCKSKSDYSFKEKFGRTTTNTMLIK